MIEDDYMGDEAGAGAFSVPISKEFYPFLEDEPFQKCLICEKYLLDLGTVYIIEKVYRGSEVIIEYAVCEDCMEKMTASYSQESLAAIQKVFETSEYFADRCEHLLDGTGDDIKATSKNSISTASGSFARWTALRKTGNSFNYGRFRVPCQQTKSLALVTKAIIRGGLKDWIDNCAITGKGAEGLYERQYSAIFMGENMILNSMFPLMLSGDAIKLFQKKLSKKTLDSMGDFVDTYLDMSPECKDLLDDSPVVFI